MRGGSFLRCHFGTIGHSPGLSTSVSRLEGCLQVLCFEACWDNSAQEFGDVRRFRVLYFLADGTMEVRHRVPTKRTKKPGERCTNFAANSQEPCFDCWHMRLCCLLPGI